MTYHGIVKKNVNKTDLSRVESLNHALELFHFAYRKFTEGPDRLLERRGLARVHHRILYFVGRNPRISVNGLLQILAITKQSLHAPLRQLVQMQLVEACEATHDRRVKELSLTKEGASLEASLSGLQRRRMARIFDAVGADAETTWCHVMATIAQ